MLNSSEKINLSLGFWVFCVYESCYKQLPPLEQALVRFCWRRGWHTVLTLDIITVILRLRTRTDCYPTSQKGHVERWDASNVLESQTAKLFMRPLGLGPKCTSPDPQNLSRAHHFHIEVRLYTESWVFSEDHRLEKTTYHTIDTTNLRESC